MLRGAIHAGWSADELRPWFTAVVSDHLLSYGHAAIYSQKAFQLLDLLGWERADTVLPHLVPTIVNGTREDTLPYMRPFTKALAGLDLRPLAWLDADPTWRDDGALRAAILGGGRDRAAVLHAAVDALREGAGVDGLLDVVVDCVAERMLRYDPAGEFDFHDDFGWLDITHGITYANAARWHAGHAASGDIDERADAVRLALWCVFLAHWTGRHEWHTATRRAGRGRPRHVRRRRRRGSAAAAGARRHDDGVHRPRPRRQDVTSGLRRGRPSGLDAPVGSRRPVHRGAEAGTLRRRDRDPLDRLPLRPHPPRLTLLTTLGSLSDPQATSESSSAGGSARTA